MRVNYFIRIFFIITLAKKNNSHPLSFYKGFQKDNDIINPKLYEGVYLPKRL